MGAAMRGILTVVLLLAAGAARAQGGAGLDWWPLPGLNSAKMLEDKWDLVSSSGHSWPDGRQAIVTFWRKPAEGAQRLDIVRCIDFFDADFGALAGICQAVLVPGQPAPERQPE